MFGATFYHRMLRKYVITFGNMFNDIDVQRLDSNDERIQTLRIPIAYGPKQKFLARLSQDPNLDQDVAISLPRIGFEVVGLNYSPTRKLSSTQQNYYVESDGNVKVQYAPVPYDIQIAMSIFAKNADDGAQIIEQILPYFQPEWTNSIKLVPGMNLTYDVPTVLNDVSVEDTYEGDFETRRALIWNLNFTMKGYMFGPTNNRGLITRAITNTYTGVLPDATVYAERVTTQPGLTSAGEPTSNTALSIDRDDIKPTDDYGFASSITEFT